MLKLISIRLVLRLPRALNDRDRPRGDPYPIFMPVGDGRLGEGCPYARAERRHPRTDHRRYVPLSNCAQGSILLYKAGA